MTIRELEDTYIEDLNMLGDWFLQYEYLLELASELGKIPDEAKTEENRVKGCQSGVWLLLSEKDGIVHVQADSEALIIRGMLAVIVQLLDGRHCEEAAAYDPRFIKETNLARQISTDRFNGLHAVIDTIREFAGDRCRKASA